MKRNRDKLTALRVSREKRPGLHGDGGGLYLRIPAAGTRSWIFRYRFRGRTTPRDMGLGAAHDVSLARAREKAADARKLLAEGQDPIDTKRAKEGALAAAKAIEMTFEDCASAYIKSHAAAWRNAKHGAQWAATLRAYVYPIFGKLPVAAIETAHVMRVLDPIWSVKPETASRVRGRVEAILSWATTSGFRAGANPAQWRGHLDNLLPARSAVRKVSHHAALPYAQVGAFMEELRKQNGVAARALEFTILTAARTGEAIGAKWSEIDLNNAVWTIPADRMKGGKEHRSPLSEPAVALLKVLKQNAEVAYVFSSSSSGQPLSNNSMLALLGRMDRGNVTVHGFRSAFRDWASEQTGYPHEVAELALAHAIGDKVEAAYRRGDLLEKRRRMMADWGTYCGTVSKAGSNVVRMQRQN